MPAPIHAPIPIPNHLYPVVIFQDRYGGCYSGGWWFAVANCGHERDASLADGPFGGDTDALDFWHTPPDWIAVGQTPDEALGALLSRFA